MKKRMVTLIVFLLTACMLLTGCSSATTANPTPNTTPVDEYEADTPPTEAPNTETISGMHSYEVGGVTLQCKTRIEDYIKGQYFMYFDLARDLGWHAERPEFEGVPTMNTRIFENGEHTAYLLLNSKYHNIYGLGYYVSSNEVVEDIHLEENDSAKVYVLNDQNGETIDSRIVILVTYILENYKNDPCKDLFEGIFRHDGVYHVE